MFCRDRSGGTRTEGRPCRERRDEAQRLESQLAEQKARFVREKKKPVLVGLCVLASMRFSRQLFEPIRALNSAMREVEEGNLNVQLDNRRTDEYGGSLENRTRLLRESIAGAREVCGASFLVSSRLNVYDGFAYPNGFGVRADGSLDFDPTEPIWLLERLSGLGVPLVDITMGNPYFNPHVNRPFASGGYDIDEHPLTGVARMLCGTATLRRAVPDMKMICSALTYLGVAAPHVAAGFVKNGGFDVAGFGRTAFAYPDFARDILKTGEMDPKKICICCSKCTQIMRTSGGTPGCVIRDRAVYGPIFEAQCGGKTK